MDSAPIAHLPCDGKKVIHYEKNVDFIGFLHSEQNDPVCKLRSGMYSMQPVIKQLTHTVHTESTCSVCTNVDFVGFFIILNHLITTIIGITYM